MEHTILCIDDEIDNVDALERLFRKKYRVQKATSGTEALAILEKNPSISLIISDQRMPEMTGVEFFEKSLNTHPSAIRILLTGYTDIDSIIAAINSGQIYRYVTKPWDPLDLMTAVDRGIEKFELIHELQIKNIELEKALKELSQLDKAKDQFMILINHELKTPLTTVLSFLELLKETELSQEQQHFLSRVQKSSLRLKEIIDDVLKIVSAETGVLKTNKKMIPAKELFLKAPTEFDKLLEKKNQQLKIDLIDSPVLADKKVIEEVILRLIDNAHKFGDPQSEILISNSVSDKIDKLKFVIENKGQPIRPEVIDKVLKPFTLDENIMNHSKGLGLGLSLCQALLKTHHSHLHIQCEHNIVQISFDLSIG